jgi:hypothetical protein
MSLSQSLIVIIGIVVSLLVALYMSDSATHENEWQRERDSIYNAVKSIPLKRLEFTVDGKVIQHPLDSASSLWQDHGALLMLVRRPGCLLCRVSDCRHRKTNLSALL